MFILVNPDTNVLIKISENCIPIIINKGEHIQCEEDKATSYLLDGLIYPKTLPVKMYEVDSIPKEVTSYRYLYTEKDGFVINTNYEEDISINIENFRKELYQVVSDIYKLDEYNIKINNSKTLDTTLYLGSDEYFIDKDGNGKFNELRVFNTLNLGNSGSEFYLDLNGKAKLDVIDTEILNVDTLNINYQLILNNGKIKIGSNNIDTDYYLDDKGNANLYNLTVHGHTMFTNKVLLGPTEKYYLNQNGDGKLSDLNIATLNVSSELKFDKAKGEILDIYMLNSTSFIVNRKFDTSFYPIIESINGPLQYTTLFGWDGVSDFGLYDTETKITGNSVNLVPRTTLNLSSPDINIHASNKTSIKNDNNKIINIIEDNIILYTDICYESSIRHKENIKYVDSNYWHDRLMQVKPCTFNYKTENSDIERISIVSEDLEKVFPDLVRINGNDKSIKIFDLVVMLISEVQRLNSIIENK